MTKITRKCVECGKPLTPIQWGATDFCSPRCVVKHDTGVVDALTNIINKVHSNDGSNDGTSHYDLPEGATELKHLIWHKDMNAQEGEIFRSAWRLGSATHSSKARDLRKIIAYAEQELEREEWLASRIAPPVTAKSDE